MYIKWYNTRVSPFYDQKNEFILYTTELPISMWMWVLMLWIKLYILGSSILKIY